MSNVRRAYTLRLVGRAVIFLGCLLLFVWAPDELKILRGNHFFRRFSVLHLLWGIWMADMVFQLVPVKAAVALGSQKIFSGRYKPAEGSMDSQALKAYMAGAAKGAGKVFGLWLLLTAVIGFLYWKGILNDSLLFLITVFFYVCDLICVVVICPFRLIMGNRCCTTCRIFNWDHLMMFAPVVYIDGFYTRSLFFMALAVWVVWEFSAARHPERFWEGTNRALRCLECSDKLCPRYDHLLKFYLERDKKM